MRPFICVSALLISIYFFASSYSCVSLSNISISLALNYSPLSISSYLELTLRLYVWFTSYASRSISILIFPSLVVSICILFSISFNSLSVPSSPICFTLISFITFSALHVFSITYCSCSLTYAICDSMFLTLASCNAIAFPFWYSCSSLPSRIYPTLTSFVSFLALSFPCHSASSYCAYSTWLFTCSHCSCLY